jgi:hypothetical protein
MPPRFSGASHLFTGALAFAVAALLGGGFTCWGRPTAAELFEGVTYGCERLASNDEGSGVIHWVRVDLTASGIALFVTPLDRTAAGQGWQYRLRRVADVVAKEHLAVAINGTLFSSDSSRWLPMSGDLADGVEPVVADHIASHFWDDAYLLWFDDKLTPRLRPAKPLTLTELSMAKWAIGGQDLWLRDGKVWSGNRRALFPSARTAVAVDIPRKLLFLAVGTHVSPHLIFQSLADLGAKDGMLLDGGNSSSLAIGEGASHGLAGAVFGAWRPVANHFGVRANPLLGVKANSLRP